MAPSTVYSKDCNNYLQNIMSILSIDELEKLSKQHGFIQKTRILDLATTIKLLSYAAQGIGSLTLTNYCTFVEEQISKSITKQSMAERFSQRSINFVKALLEKVLTQKLALKNLKQDKFKKIMLIDSTGFELCPKFSHAFKGTNNSGGLKIQYAFDLISGGISVFDVTNGVMPDSNYSTTQNIEPEVLYIQDLGYFTMEGFEKIQKNGGYFLSRYSTSCSLYNSQDKKEKSIDFVALVAMFLSVGKSSCSTKYYLSQKQRLPIRFVMFPVPEEIAKERMTKRRKKGNAKSNPKPETIANSKVTIYITNVPENILSDEKIRAAYKLRWAIELTFKIWKSVFKLDEVKNMSLNRFLTLFYFKLIILLIDFQVVTSIVMQAAQNGFILSLHACCAIFKEHYAARFHEYILNNKGRKLPKLIRRMKQTMLKHCEHDENIKRLRLYDILYLIT
jgi:hypothetical protein